MRYQELLLAYHKIDTIYLGLTLLLIFLLFWDSITKSASLKKYRRLTRPGILILAYLEYLFVFIICCFSTILTGG